MPSDRDEKRIRLLHVVGLGLPICHGTDEDDILDPYGRCGVLDIGVEASTLR